MPPPTEVVVPVPVRVVNQFVQVVQSDGKPAPVELRCPACKQRLTTVEVDVAGPDVSLSGCGRCGGIWIDNASSQALLAAPQRVFIDLATRAGQNARHRGEAGGATDCPKCDARLERVRSHGIDLDICADHGTWFDAFELRTLIERVVDSKQPKVDPKTVKVACVGCLVELTADRANIGEHGPLCDGCWRNVATALASAPPDLGRAASEMLKASKGIGEVFGHGLIGVAILAGGGISAGAAAKAIDARGRS